MPPRKGPYKASYNEATIEEALEAMKAGMSSREAERTFGIPHQTLSDRFLDKHGSKQGRPTILNKEEEKYIVEMMLLMGDWGFPFNADDLRHFVKAYLDKKGAESKFTDNLPTKRWVECFLKRHPTLTKRSTNSIKRSRASVSREEINKFFANFLKTAEGVEPKNMWNYDETNLRDDPNNKKCIYKKGTKYCEKVQNTSKQEQLTAYLPFQLIFWLGGGGINLKRIWHKKCFQ